MDDTVIQNFKAYMKQFVEMPDEQIVSFAKITTKVSNKKGDHFSTPDKPSSFMGFVTKGLFRAYVIDEESKEIILDFIGDAKVTDTQIRLVFQMNIPHM